MYYRKHEPLLSFSIKSGNIELAVNPENYDARFELKNEGKSFKSLEEALGLISDEKLKKEIKKAVYKSLRKLFFTIEQKIPDATTGIIPFMEGKDFRTTISDHYYNFKLTPELVEPNFELQECNVALELEQYLISNLKGKWPIELKLNIKHKKGFYDFSLLYDPYALINIFASNIEGAECDLNLYTTTGEKKLFHFKSYPDNNLIKIYFGNEEIRISYDVLQINILDSINNFFNYTIKNPVDGICQYVPSSFVIDHYRNKCVNFTKKDKLRWEHLIVLYEQNNSLFNPDMFCWNIPDLHAIGVSDHFLYVDPKGSFEDASPRLKEYTLKLSKLNKCSPSDLIKLFRSDESYVCSDSFIRF